MIQHWFREPRRDAELADALRRIEGEATHSSVSDEALRARIVQAARSRLAAQRIRPRLWWEWTVAWARIAVPIGLAASVAAAVVLVWGGSESVELSTAVTDTISASNVTDSLLAPASDEWLLSQVISSPTQLRDRP